MGLLFQQGHDPGTASAEALTTLNARLQARALRPLVVAVYGLGWFAVNVVLQRPELLDKAVVYYPAYLVLGGVAVWLAHWRDQRAKTTVLVYELDEGQRSRFDAVCVAFEELAGCAKRWRLERGNEGADHTAQAGASAVVQRTAVTFTTRPPRWFSVNVPMPSVPVRGETLCFLPDGVLLVSSRAAGAIDYRDLHVEVAAESYIEEGTLPPDATVISNTWRHPDTEGGPDQRFKKNPEIPIVRYEGLTLWTASGLRVELQFSKAGVGEAFAQAVAALTSAIDGEAHAPVLPPPLPPPAERPKSSGSVLKMSPRLEPARPSEPKVGVADVVPLPGVVIPPQTPGLPQPQGPEAVEIEPIPEPEHEPVPLLKTSTGTGDRERAGAFRQRLAPEGSGVTSVRANGATLQIEVTPALAAEFKADPSGRDEVLAVWKAAWRELTGAPVVSVRVTCGEFDIA